MGVIGAWHMGVEALVRAHPHDDDGLRFNQASDFRHCPDRMCTAQGRSSMDNYRLDNAVRPRPTWGRTLAVWIVATMVCKGKAHQMAHHECQGVPRVLRCGGGPSRAKDHSKDEFARSQAELVAVALKPWGARYVNDAGNQASASVEEDVGGSLDASTRRNHEGHFEKWETYRSVNGLSPYIDTRIEAFTHEEDIVLCYVALSVGPLGKEVSTMVTHLSDIGYFHRVRTGCNPLVNMPRAQLMLTGFRLARGPA